MTSVYDLPLVARRPEYFANKFMLSYDPVAYQCLEEWYDTRVKLDDVIPTDLNYYCEFIKPYSTRVNCGNRPKRIKATW